MENEKYKRLQMMCNTADPLQKQIYDHVKSQSNISSYLKMLVFHDLFKDNRQSYSKPPDQSEPKEPVQVDLNSFI